MAGFQRLTHLSLLENPVASKEVRFSEPEQQWSERATGDADSRWRKLIAQQNYRYWVLWRCPNVRFLDFQKVKQAEREKSEELFGTQDSPTALAQKVCPNHTLPTTLRAY